MLDLDYRPRTYDEYVIASRTGDGVSKLRRRAARAMDRCSAINLSITGPSGVGKSTLAQLLARHELGAVDATITVLPSGHASPDRLRDIEREWHYSTIFGAGWRVLIIEEAHELSAQARNVLLTLAEVGVKRRAIILTTTTKPADMPGGVAGPLMSRFKPTALSKEGLVKPGAARLKQIAQSEGVDGKPLEYYEGIVSQCKGNLRLAVQALEDE